VYKWLETALDYGISEECYWNMTLAELDREIESRKRQQREKAKEKASFDYILADLIGRSVARIHSSSNKMPSIAEAYPSLFVAEEIEAQQQQKKDELSILRFKQFTQSFNKRFKGDSK
jgi:hypothetical protein